MIIKPEKIMPLAVSCREFCSLVYGLIDTLDFYSSYSKNKNYENHFDKLELLKSMPLWVKTEFISKLNDVDSLTKTLIEEVRNNPKFNTEFEDNKRNITFVKKKKPLSFKTKTEEGITTFEYQAESQKAFRINDDTDKYEFDIENSKWPFFRLLQLCITELNIDYQNLEGWVVNFVINNFDIDLSSDIQSEQSSDMNEKRKEVQNPESLDKALVALSIILSKKSPLLESGGKPNFSKIQDAVITELQSHESASDKDKQYGLSKLGRHISQAYKTLTDKV